MSDTVKGDKPRATCLLKQPTSPTKEEEIKGETKGVVGGLEECPFLVGKKKLFLRSREPNKKKYGKKPIAKTKSAKYGNLESTLPYGEETRKKKNLLFVRESEPGKIDRGNAHQSVKKQRKGHDAAAVGCKGSVEIGEGGERAKKKRMISGSSESEKTTENVAPQRKESKEPQKRKGAKVKEKAQRQRKG